MPYLQSKRRGGPGNYPAFIAIPARRKRDRIEFEYLNVNELLGAGPTPAELISGDATEIITIYWPGLEPGGYEKNILRVENS